MTSNTDVSNKAHTDYVQGLTLDKCDPAQGQLIKAALAAVSLENPTTEIYSPQHAHDNIMSGIRYGLQHLGLDMTDPSMADTPRRYATMLVGELTKGLNYDFFPKCTATPAFDDEMVVVKKLDVMSLCEHHLQTITGFAHIAYIPNKKLLGLSKFARVTEFFCRRPQVQERLTAQIYCALSTILETEDVAVIIEAEHFCMKARGAMQHASVTSTNKMGGRFLTNPQAKQEFLHVVR